MTRSKMKHLGKRVLAVLLALAFVCSGMNVTSWQVQAEESSIDLSVKSGSNSSSATFAKNEYGTDYIADVFFDVPTQLASKSAMNASGVTKMEVKLTINSFTAGGSKAPTVMLFAQPGEDGNWEWNQSDAEELVKGKQVTLTYAFSKMDWNSGSTMGNLGFRFADTSENTSSVSFSIDSAKVIMSDSAVGGTDKVDESEVSIESILTASSNDNWKEYEFSITNHTTSAVSGVQILIPTSGAVSPSVVYGYSAGYDSELGGVVVYYSGTIAAGQTVSASDDYKVGYSPNGTTTYTPYVIAKDCDAPTISGSSASGTELEYDITGDLKDLAYEETPVGKHGKLSLGTVSGYGNAKTIVDANGDAYQLRGASSHGINKDWYPEYVNEKAMQTLRDNWGANVFRIAAYPREYNGYTTSTANQEFMDAKIQEGVEAAKKLGMYVIVDWHVLAYNPNETLTEAKQFFQTYAEKYKDYDNVLFEICNEPTGTSWYNDGSGNDLYTYGTEIVKTIRDTGSENLIICGTNNYSQEIDDVAEHPLSDANTLYTLHFYAGESGHNSLKSRLKSVIEAGTPIFVTEFGITPASGDGAVDTNNANEWIALLDKYNISYCCWAMCNKGETASYFNTSCTKTDGGWVASDLAVTGVWLVNTLRAHQEAEEETSNPDAVSRVSLDNTTLSLVKGDSVALTATVSPTTATDKTVAWTSSDSEIASVDANGKVTAVSAGTATITVTTNDGSKTATCKVTVAAPSLTLDKSALTLSVGETATLKATSNSGTPTWTSSDTKVATVDANGKVTAVAAGTATITATIGSGSDAVQASCIVTVSKKTLNITAPEKITVDAGTKISEITFDKFSATSGTTAVEGTFSWVTADKTLDFTDNEATLTAKFMPKDSASYDSQTTTVSVIVNRIERTSTPAAPTVSSATANTVTLKATDGMEYSISSGTAFTDWQTDNVFTGLSEYTTYQFAQRYAQDNTYLASAASKSVSATTYYSDANCKVVDLSKLSTASYVTAHNGYITYDDKTKTLTLTADKGPFTITGEDTSVTIVTNGNEIVLKNAQTGAIQSGGDLDITLNGVSTVAGGISAENNVTMQTASSSSGSLSVTGGTKAAIEGATVTLKSGTVSATGSDNAAAIKADEVVVLTDGSLTVNAEVTPIQADKIVLEDCTVTSNSDSIYSTSPVDKDGNEITLCTVTYKAGTTTAKASVRKGATVTLPTEQDADGVYKQSGAKLNGWKLDNAGDVLAAGSEVTITEDASYTADYTVITGSVTMTANTPDNLKYGYTADSDGVTVTITNNTNVTVDLITLALEGDDFTLDTESIEQLESKASQTVRVKLKNGKSAGTYKASLSAAIVSAECDSPEALTISRTVEKKASDAPNVTPVVIGTTADTITLQAVDNCEYGYKEKNAAAYTWTDQAVITGLKAYTTYTLALRYAANENSAQSAAGSSIDVTTLMSEEAKYEVNLTQLTNADYVSAHGGTIAYDATTKTLTLSDATATYTISGENADVTVVASGDNKIVLDGAKLKSIQGKESQSVTVEVKSNSVIAAGAGAAGIDVKGTLTLTKTEVSESATLTVTGGDGAAGIKAGNVTIVSGTVTVTGGSGSAAIEADDAVTIAAESTVTVKGGSDAAGIQATSVTIKSNSTSVTGQGAKPAIDAETIELSDGVTITDGASYENPNQQDGDDEKKDDTSKDDTKTDAKDTADDDAPTTYKVTYQIGTQTTTQDVEEDKVITLPEITPKNGYTAHWSDGTTNYEVGDSYKVTKAVTFTAVYEKEDTDTDDEDEEITPSLTVSNILIQKGKTFTLKTNDKAVKITAVSYSNSKTKKLVTASSSGKIKAKKTGTGKLKVTLKYDGKSYTKVVNVKVQNSPVIELKKKVQNVTLKRKARCRLVNPANMLSVSGMKFTSASSKIATVSSKGEIKGVKKGKTKITVKLGKNTYTVNVKVK